MQDTRRRRLMERERELAAIDRALGAARAGTGSLVLIEGPAGIGKSGLLDAAAQRGAAEGLLVLRGRGAELEQALPFGVARQLLSPALAALAQEDRRRVLGGAADGAASVLAERPAPGPEGPGDLAASVDALHWLVHGLTGLPQAGAGVLLLVDDLQWADRSTVRLLVRLAVGLDELPVAVVLALRTGEPVPRELLARLRGAAGALPLRPATLSPAAVATLVRETLDPDASPALCDACAKATGGNPFLVRELVAHLREVGAPTTPAGTFELAGMVPDSVVRSVLLRLARLPPAATELARAGATLGPDTPLRLAAAVAGLSFDAAQEAAEALDAAGLLHAAEPLRLAHPLIAGAVQEEMSQLARSDGHRRAAEVLTAEGAPADRVAAHLRHTVPRGDAWAVGVLRAGGADSMARGEAAGAVALLERALVEPPTATERPGLLVELAYAEAANGSPRALDHLEESRRSTDDPRTVALMLQAMSRLLFARGQPHAAVHAAEQGRELLHPDDPLAGRILASQLANMFFVPGRWTETERLLDELEAGLDSGRWPRERLLLAQLATRRGVWDLEPAHRTATLAREILAIPPDVGEVWQGDPSLAAALIYVDEFALAEQVLDRMDEQARRTRSPISAAMADHWRAEALLRQGRIDAAVEAAQRALAVGDMGWTSEVAWTSAVLARARLELGDRDGAGEAIAAGRDVDPGLLPHGFWLAARAEVALASGHPEAALRDFLAAGAHLRDRYALDNPAVVPWRSGAARACVSLGDTGRAAGLAAQELELARRAGIPRALAGALRAGAAAAGGASAVTALREAVELLEPSAARLEQAHVRLDLGVALRRTRQQRAAREQLELALGLARELGATATAEPAYLELRRSGSRPVPAERDRSTLTPAETRVAELAARDHSNAEIAELLVVTPRTVEWHLTQTYRKLGIRSRAGLRDALDRLG